MGFETKKGQERRVKVFEFLKDYTKRNGMPPTFREIMAGTGITSTSVIHYHLKTLEAAGLVERSPRYHGQFAPVFGECCPMCGR